MSSIDDEKVLLNLDIEESGINLERAQKNDSETLERNNCEVAEDNSGAAQSFNLDNTQSFEIISSHNTVEESLNIAGVLEKLKGSDFLAEFISHGVTVESLPFIKPHHLDKICSESNLGKRAIFEHHLVEWQKKQCPSFEGSVSCNESESSFSPTLSPTLSPTPSFLEDITNANFSESDSSCDDFLNIDKIILTSGKGKLILEYYKANKILTNKQRRTLADLLVHYWIAKEVTVNPDFLKKASERIVCLFPTETKEFYFIRIKNRKPGGVLYSKYHNCVYKYRLDGSILSKKDVKSTPPAISCSSEDFERTTSLKKWLQFNISPKEEVFQKWTETTELRLKSLSTSNNLFEILTEWPLYKQSYGYQLIEIDFDCIYSAKGHLLFNKFETFSNKVLPFMIRDVKDENSKALITKLQSLDEKNCNTRSVLIFLIIHAILLPNRKVNHYDETVKRIVSKKVSISDSRTSFLQHVKSLTDLHNKITELTEICHKTKTSLQPTIFGVGPEYWELEDFYIYFFNTLYKVPNFIKAIDSAFKTFMVMNLKYPLPCQLVWQFIQVYFYDIHTQFDTASSTLHALLKDLQN